MIAPVQRALNATHAQLESVGLAHGSQAAWSRLGVTVMIGVNDVPGEVFTLADARKLTAFAASRHVARVSTWSINRDAPCGSVFAQTGVLSNTCSGVVQRPLQFTRIFSRLGGTGRANATAAAAAVPAVSAAPVDDPAHSPYPIWRPQASYDAGFKVVWHRVIYQAKWFSQGTSPDTPAASGGQSPWLMIGPVLAGAAAAKTVPLDATHLPAWSPTAVYHSGARVRYHGLPFVAKWYTKGDPPEPSFRPIPPPRGNRCSLSPASPQRPRPVELSSTPRGVLMSRHATVRRRRQWGADRHLDPMPVVPRIAGDGSLALGRAAAFISRRLARARRHGRREADLRTRSRAGRLARGLAFIVVVSLLAASATAYLIARLGFYQRARAHRRSPRAVIDSSSSGDARADGNRSVLPRGASGDPADAALGGAAGVPGSPRRPAHRRPAGSRGPRARELLEAAARFPARSRSCSPTRTSASPPRSRSRGGRARPPAEDIRDARRHFDAASGWARGSRERSAHARPRRPVLRRRGDRPARRRFRRIAAALARPRRGAGAAVAPRIAQLYRRLAWTFSAELSSFERKHYASLSHEPNKAMNLNSYIGLMGGRYRDGTTRLGLVLAAAPTGTPTSRSPTPTTCSRSTQTACCCPSTACASSTCSSSQVRAGRASPRRPTAHSPARPPGSSASPARRPTSSTSSTRA